MKQIPLSRGMTALVDDSDHDALMSAGPWHAFPGKRTFYARHTLSDRRSQIVMHRFLTGWPITDHVNGDGLDNQRSNLREATIPLNSANRRLYLNNSSGYKGVARRGARWIARIRVAGRLQQLGTFSTALDAAAAYDAAAVRAWGEFARLNFPLTQESA